MNEKILQFFAFAHLPPHLQLVSQVCHDAAVRINAMTLEEQIEEREKRKLFQNSSVFAQLHGDLILTLPCNEESNWAFLKIQEAANMFDDGYALSLILRRLLEAKDCAVRALLFKEAA